MLTPPPEKKARLGYKSGEEARNIIQEYGKR